MQRRGIPNLVEIRALESTLKSGRNFSNRCLISNVFPLFFEKSKKGVYFLKIKKNEKNDPGYSRKERAYQIWLKSEH